MTLKERMDKIEEKVNGLLNWTFEFSNRFSMIATAIDAQTRAVIKDSRDNRRYQRKKIIDEVSFHTFMKLIEKDISNGIETIDTSEFDLYSRIAMNAANAYKKHNIL